jgi:hypothetical protein
MSNLITLTCPSCGGRLEVTNNTERYVCAHCGNAHIVDPGVRADSLAKEVDALKNESALRRLESEIEELEKRKQALHASTTTGINPETEAALVKWGGVGLLIVAAGTVLLLGSQIGREGAIFYIFAAIPFFVAAILLAKYGLLDKRTLSRWQARHEVTLTELNDVERQLARKREEFERRKKLLAAGYYQQPTASS